VGFVSIHQVFVESNLQNHQNVHTLKEIIFMKRALLPGLLAMVVALTSGNIHSALNQNSEHLSHEVRNELVMIPQLTIFDHLAFRVDGDTVTLVGQVRNGFIKGSAEAVVKNIEGVSQVNNEIEVLPPSNNDDRIRSGVAHAIFNDSRLFRYSMSAVPPIHIIVNRGHVTLEGVVSNQTDKDTAGIRARGVAGVFSVNNNLHVESD
jgi:hyperosmotically inducible protein